MARSPNEADALFREMIVEYLDPVFSPVGFKRQKNSTWFSRSLKAALQKMEIASSRPRYSDDTSDLHIAPIMRIKMPAIENVLRDLIGDLNLLADSSCSVVAQTIGVVGPRRTLEEWRPRGKSGFSESGKSLAVFCQEWVIPFFDEYCRPEDIIKGYEKGDERLPRGTEWSLVVASAYISLGNRKQARELLTERIASKPGLKKRYAHALDHVGA